MDNMLWAAGIMNMIAQIIHEEAQAQQGRSKEREMIVRMDGTGLEASQHADLMREADATEAQTAIYTAA